MLMELALISTLSELNKLFLANMDFEGAAPRYANDHRFHQCIEKVKSYNMSCLNILFGDGINQLVIKAETEEKSPAIKDAIYNNLVTMAEKNIFVTSLRYLLRQTADIVSENYLSSINMVFNFVINAIINIYWRMELESNEHAFTKILKLFNKLCLSEKEPALELLCETVNSLLNISCALETKNIEDAILSVSKFHADCRQYAIERDPWPNVYASFCANFLNYLLKYRLNFLKNKILLPFMIHRMNDTSQYSIRSMFARYENKVEDLCSVRMPPDKTNYMRVINLCTTNYNFLKKIINKFDPNIYDEDSSKILMEFALISMLSELNKLFFAIVHCEVSEHVSDNQRDFIEIIEIAKSQSRKILNMLFSGEIYQAAIESETEEKLPNNESVVHYHLVKMAEKNVFVKSLRYLLSQPGAMRNKKSYTSIKIILSFVYKTLLNIFWGMASMRDENAFTKTLKLFRMLCLPEEEPSLNFLRETVNSLLHIPSSTDIEKFIQDIIISVNKFLGNFHGSVNVQEIWPNVYVIRCAIFLKALLERELYILDMLKCKDKPIYYPNEIYHPESKYSQYSIRSAFSMCENKVEDLCSARIAAEDSIVAETSSARDQMNVTQKNTEDLSSIKMSVEDSNVAETSRARSQVNMTQQESEYNDDSSTVGNKRKFCFFDHEKNKRQKTTPEAEIARTYSDGCSDTNVMDCFNK